MAGRRSARTAVTTRWRGGRPSLHDAIVTKRDFILAYLALFGTRPEHRIQIPQPSAAGDARISWKNPRSGAFVEAVEVRIGSSSAVVTRADSAGALAVALDPNQIGAAQAAGQRQPAPVLLAKTSMLQLLRR